MKGQSFYRRLAFAINGLYLAYLREPSFRYHVFACIGVIALLAITHPQPIWWAMGALAVGLVMATELFNTAIETLADHLHPELHPEIGAVKDIAAAADLLSSIIALLIATAFAIDWLN